ncbi:MAG TPA: flagellar hook-associated protein FlgK [Anaerolineales bacterium]|nr:flagellar hook-associated protein FlgK [Anaerolineales bacterium]HNO30503.1 flagellar hook-associated protein FlgK [Anaerolineales bacterium]
MPTISSGISIALQAVLTHSQVLEITEHNVANASTPGYRRQAAILTTDTPTSINGADHGIGAGQRGSGVTIDRIQRFNLAYFDGRFRSVSAEAKNWETQSGILSQLEATLAETSDEGLLNKLDQFWGTWQSLSNDPTNTSLRTVLLDDANTVALALNRRSSQIIQLRSDQNNAISGSVEEINSLASQIAQLNGEIARVNSVGEQPNDLMDKRDLALDRLAEITGAVSSEQKNGEVLVSVGGHALVVGRDTFQLETRTSTTDSSVLDVYWEDNQKLNLLSGELKGTLEVRDRVLVDQMNGLNTFAAQLASQVNAIHRTGYGINNATNLDFFTGTDAASIAVNPNLDALSIATSSAANQAGNNTVALQILDLKNFKGMSGNTATLNEYYNAQVTGLAVLTKRAADNSYQHELVVHALGNQRESVAGVSLDEEAANMAKAQKAYQAAARVLTAYDELLNVVINQMGLVGR